MGWFQRWRQRRRVHKALSEQLKQADSTRSTATTSFESLPAPRADGFMPLRQFSNSALVDNLEASVWAYSCITGNAEAIASLPGIVQKPGKEGADKWVEDNGRHSLNKFLEHPLGNSESGAPGWNWQQLIETICLQIPLCGNSYLIPYWLDDGNRLAVELVLDPSQIEVDTDHRGFPVVYRHRISGQQWAPNEICNIQNAHPSSFHQGQAPLSAAWKDIQMDSTAHQRQVYNLQNRIGSGLVIKEDSFFGPDKEKNARLLANLKANYVASTKDGTPLVVNTRTELGSVPQQGHADELTKIRTFAQSGNLAVLKTPPPIIGQYDNATLQNFDRATKIWWMNCLFPLAGSIYNAINTQIIRKRWPKVRLWYDITGSDIGLLVLQDRIAAAKSLTDLGYNTNVAAARVGLGMEYDPNLDKPNRDIEKAGREETDPAKEAPAEDEAEGQAEETEPKPAVLG
jgi:phage portal protein BeeE